MYSVWCHVKCHDFTLRFDLGTLIHRPCLRLIHSSAPCLIISTEESWIVCNISAANSITCVFSMLILHNFAPGDKPFVFLLLCISDKYFIDCQTLCLDPWTVWCPVWLVPQGDLFLSTWPLPDVLALCDSVSDRCPLLHSKGLFRHPGKSPELVFSIDLPTVVLIWNLHL